MYVYVRLSCLSLNRASPFTTMISNPLSLRTCVNVRRMNPRSQCQGDEVDVLRQERTGDMGLVRMQDALPLPAVRWSPQVRPDYPKGGAIVFSCHRLCEIRPPSSITQKEHVLRELAFEPR